MDITNLLVAINQVQQTFLSGEYDAEALFNHLLETLLTLTESEYGFIGRILYREENTPYLKVITLTNIAWNEETHKLYESHKESGLEFHNLQTLFGKVITTQEVVISNAPLMDIRSGGLPEGHPAMHAFLGIPLKFKNQLTGLIGIANRPQGYDKDLVDFLNPFSTTCTLLIQAIDAQTAQKEAFDKNKLFLENTIAMNQKLAVREEALSASEEELRQTNAHLLQINQQLEESENKYRYLFEYSPLPMWVYDLETLQFLDVNHATLENYGYTKKEFLEMTILDIRPQEDSEKIKNFIAQGLDKYNYSNIWRHTKKNSEIIDVEVVGHLIEYNGKEARLVLANNVSEKIKAETQLRRSEANLKALFDSSNQFLFLLNKDFRILQVNQTAIKGVKRIFDKDICIGDAILDYIFGDIQAKIRTSFHACLQGNAQSEEIQIPVPNNKILWMKTTCIPVLDSRNELLGISFSILDITEQKNAIVEIEKINEILQSLFDNLPVMVAMFDEKGEFIFCNQTWVDTLGYTLDEMKGTDMLAKFYPNPLEKQSAYEFMTSDSKEWKDFKTYTKFGTYIDTSWANVQLSNHTSIGIGQDISQRKNAEEKIYLREVQLAIQNQQLREYAFITSHELRRPLANILGLISLFNFDNLADEFNPMIMQNLIKSSQELDSVIYQMNQVLEEKQYNNAHE